MSDPTLFPLDGIPSETPVALSADARRTAVNNELLAAGRHPATHRPLTDQAGATCGTCAHHHAYQDRPTKTWHKCDRHRLGQSHSAASDIRVSWPAFVLYDPQEPT